MEIQELLLNLFTEFVMEVLKVLVPVAATAASAWVIGKATAIWQQIKAERPNVSYWMQEAVRIAVIAAEQLGANDVISDKLVYAMGIAQEYLNDRGFGNVNLEILRALIEAEVLIQFPNKTKES